VLQKHWPTVVNHGDITKIDFTQVEPVDMLCGGFPCQDASLGIVGHSQRLGTDGIRTGLYRHVLRAIRALRPRLVVLENVSALLTAGFGDVLGGLAEVGYDAEWYCLPASYLGAPHRRDRVWVLAYPRSVEVEAGQLEAGRNGSPGLGHPGERGGCFPIRLQAWDGWADEPGLARMVHGIPDRVDRTRCLGNSIVPQCALVIFQAIAEAEEKLRAA
jgi:DNA (cytosine-5)-methyltransferase 1